jgi:hypothetical protein
MVRPPGSTAFLLLEMDSKFTGSNLHGFAIVLRLFDSAKNGDQQVLASMAFA